MKISAVSKKQVPKERGKYVDMFTKIAESPSGKAVALKCEDGQEFNRVQSALANRKRYVGDVEFTRSSKDLTIYAWHGTEVRTAA
jgi:hypothetical protein